MAAPPLIITDPAEMRAWSRARRAEGKRVGFVPTMGCLHAGHLSLVERARQLVDIVVVSIYVNPTQFAAHEDFGVYPRQRGSDRAALESAHVDVCFEPETLYAGGDAGDTAHVVGAAGGGAAEPEAWVTVDALAAPLCGVSRPHFFRGVATVVTKLFNIVDPDVAVFGRKDAQQLAVVRAFTRGLHFGIRIEGAPIVREADGLAMSSRNALLKEGDRKAAPAIRRALVAAVDAVTAAGSAGAPTAPILDGIAAAITDSGGRVDYVAAVDAGTLTPVERAAAGPSAPHPTLFAVAANYGTVRLIDNVVVGGPDEG